MAEQFRSIADLANLKAKEDGERDKVLYRAYLNNLIELVNDSNSRHRKNISFPNANAQNEYVCIREPLEFINLFQGCSNQDDYIELFTTLLKNRDERVVSQVIYNQNNASGLWFNTTKNGINLRPGLKDEAWSSPDVVTLGDDAVHALVAGRTGSGKSVFLNNLIFSLMAEYSPWELDLFLADFKKVEFSRYLSKYDVPHVKAVAATSEIRYVVSLLTYLHQCMIARQNFFSYLGIQKLSEVRTKYDIVLPRVLLVVDEFQQLFLESTSREQSAIQELLTAITKLGRATGYHLLFASQEMTSTLGSSIFSNFKARFALACTSDVSNTILGNSEASNIGKKGTVIANLGGGKDGNMTFKVPFISDNYFYDYLGSITKLAQNYSFKSVHKFYQEDSIKEFSILEDLLDKLTNIRSEYIHENSSIFDILTLGNAVVFNYKKHDYETAFLEKGIRKNIGVFSPSVDDTAYICKLLASNFNKSPRSKEYKHYLLARNDLFTKKYDIAGDIKPQNRAYTSLDVLDRIVDTFEKRRREAELINNYHQYSSLKDFAFDAFCLRTQYVADYDKSNEAEIFNAWIEISQFFDGYAPSDIPFIKNKISEVYEFDNSYYRIIDMLYEYEVNNKALSELFEPAIVWIIGCEMVGKFPRSIESVLTDSTLYNMLFVLVASNIDFNDFYMLQKTCDYIFVTGNNESYYTKLKMPFTKKSRGSLAIDFIIVSTSTQRSFKKFNYELEEVVIPEIDFDGGVFQG